MADLRCTRRYSFGCTDAKVIVNVDADTDACADANGDGDAYTSTNIDGECAVHVPLLFRLPCM